MRHPRPLACVGLVTALALGPASATAQTLPRPIRPSDPSTIRGGRIVLQTGFEYAANLEFPLSGLSGDLWSLADARLRVGLSSNVELSAAWTLQQVLSVEGRGPSAIPLSVDSDDTPSDFGDFSVGLLWRIARAKGARPGLGLRLETRLPTTNETRGIGTNTTDFFSAVTVARRFGPWRLLGDVGVGILGAPAEVGEQNDILIYAFAGTIDLSARTRAFAAVSGQASTRGRVPVGTEDRAVLRLGLDYAVGALRLDGNVLLGAYDRDPDWGLSLGVSWTAGWPGSGPPRPGVASRGDAVHIGGGSPDLSVSLPVIPRGWTRVCGEGGYGDAFPECRRLRRTRSPLL